MIAIGALALPGPVMTASGVFGYGTEFAARMSLTGLGAVVCKGTTREPRAGNVPLRLAETPGGMLNAIGLANIGVDAVIAEQAPIWAGWDVPVIVNVSGSDIAEYADIAGRLRGVAGIAGIELNISCPNVKAGGIAFGVDPRAAAAVTRAVHAAADLPLVVKLSPNVSDIAAIARAVESEGADAVSLINTLYGLSIDRPARRPLLTAGRGGLSGPAVKPLALALVSEVAAAVRVPVIGIGGILTWQDAADYILAGASAVQMGTALLLDPTAWRPVTAGLRRWLEAEGGLDAVVGAANPRFKGRTGG